VTDDEKAYRKKWRAWALYDVGNSAFWLIIVAAIFPVYYQDLHVQTQGLTQEAGQELKTRGGSRLGYTAALAMSVIALLGPILGAIADRSAAKKRFLAFFAGVGIVGTGLMVLIGPGEIWLASVLYAVGTIGVAGSMVFYDALLPVVARQEDLDRVSAIGFAAGYLGSVILFVMTILLIQYPKTFGLADAGAAARLSFLGVAVWWALFTIPLLRHVQEPATAEVRGNLLVGGFLQLGRTFRKMGRHKQMILFLIAFWIYSDGIGTIIKMATAFGNILGVGRSHLMIALVITQVVGVPCAMLFARLARRIGGKASILMGLATYAGICVFAMFMNQTWHFYALAIAVGLVQGGTQALSRSLFASMIPPGQSGEFFGFFSTMEKFAGIAGPFLLGILWGEGGDPRRGILALSLFFVVGFVILWRVDVAEGQRAAAESP
jgi:UMF1 family MFS transporter